MLNVIDAHDDVTVPGAFDVGSDVIIGAYGHASWGGLTSAAVLPAGKGVIGADSGKAWVDGEFFLDTASGRETYATAKRLGPLMQWSYGFDPLRYDFGEFEGRDNVRFLRELKVHEVSPVLVGAGVNTRTEWVKGCSNCADPARADVAAIARRNAARLRSIEADDPDLRAAMSSARKLTERIRAQIGEEIGGNATDDRLAVEAAAFAARVLGIKAPPIRWFHRGERSLRGYASDGLVRLSVDHGAAATSAAHQVETVVHEVLHIAEPHRSHDDVAEIAQTIARLFWDEIDDPVSKGPVYPRPFRMSVGA